MVDLTEISDSISLRSLFLNYDVIAFFSQNVVINTVQLIINQIKIQFTFESATYNTG